MVSNLILASSMQYGDVEGLRIWFAEHLLSHNSYAGKVPNAPSFDLADMFAMDSWSDAMEGKEGANKKSDLLNWLKAHQELHNAELKVMQYNGTINLSTVDFGNEDQFYDWMNIHQQIHAAEDGLLT